MLDERPADSEDRNIPGRTHRSRLARIHRNWAAATIRVIWIIDNALAPIKRKLIPPCDEVS
jgi:hypothetical protein